MIARICKDMEEYIVRILSRLKEDMLENYPEAVSDPNSSVCRVRRMASLLMGSSKITFI